MLSLFFSDCLLYCCWWEGKVWAQRPFYLSFSPPFLGTLKHNQDHRTWAAQLIVGCVVWTKLGAPETFQASPYLCMTSSICGPALVFFLSASTDSIFLCFMAQDKAAQKTRVACCFLQSIKAHLKETTIFLPPSSPCLHSRTKLRLQELHLCAGVTPQPHHLTYNKQQTVLQF